MCSTERLLYIIRYGIAYVKMEREVDGKIESTDQKHIMRYQQLFAEICDYKEIHDSVGKEKYGLVLSHYPIFSWKNMGRGKILLYGHTHVSAEDQFYQQCLKQMKENDCRHVYDKDLRAFNVGCMLPYMDYTPRTLEEIMTEAGECFYAR